MTEALVVRVKVTARAKKERVEKKGTVLLLSIKEPAQDNRANERVRQIVAQRYAVPMKNVRIVSGHHKPTKRLEIQSTNIETRNKHK